MCSFYLDLERPRWFREGRPGAVFPWCMVRARGSFRQPQTFNIHSARLAARRLAASSKGPSSWPFPLLPGLESGSALKRRSTISLLVVFKTMKLSENQGLALKTGGKRETKMAVRPTLCGFDLRISAPKRQMIPRKEVIQPQVPLRLPCYDFTPVTDHSLVGPFLTVEVPTSGATDSHGVTGGVYKDRERIHRSVLISDY